MRYLIAALLFTVSSAQAQNVKINGTDGATKVIVTPTTRVMTVQSRMDTEPVFEMKSGACLRGPLSIKDGHGKDLFTLAPGVTYPAGCL